MGRFAARLDRIAAKVDAMPCKVCHSLRRMLFYIHNKPGDEVAERQWEVVGYKCPRCGSEPDRLNFVIVDGPQDIVDAA